MGPLVDKFFMMPYTYHVCKLNTRTMLVFPTFFPFVKLTFFYVMFYMVGKHNDTSSVVIREKGLMHTRG